MKKVSKARLLIFLLSLLVVVILVTELFARRLPQETAVNAWKNIIPGKTTPEEVESSLGQPQQKAEIEGKMTYFYQSPIPDWPDKIQLSEDQKVVEIIKHYFPSASENYQSFLDKYGSPDKELFGPHAQAGFSVFVFLQKGVAVIANPDSGKVMEIWYFPPKNLGEFLTLYGKDLSSTPPKQF